MSLIFDSHAHYDDEAFDPDRDALLSSLLEKGVGWVMNPSASVSGAYQVAALAERHPRLYAAVGIHPEEAASFHDGDLQKLKELAHSTEKVRAIGEIGLDYHYEDMAPRETQRRVFEGQIILAKELGLPVIVHDRDAHGDTLDLLRRHRPRGVVHCFSGSVEMMREVVALGMYIGLGGAVTFKNARVPVEVAQAVPLDRLLLETDAPYMTPVPFRGKRNDSALIAYTAQKIAALRGIDQGGLCEIAAQNAAALYDINLEEQ